MARPIAAAKSSARGPTHSLPGTAGEAAGEAAAGEAAAAEGAGAGA